MTPEERKARAVLGAHTSWANTADPSARTAAARKAALERFEKEAREAHPEASPERIAQIAEHLKKAFYARMQLASAQKRAARTRSKKAGAKASSKAA